MAGGPYAVYIKLRSVLERHIMKKAPAFPRPATALRMTLEQTYTYSYSYSFLLLSYPILLFSAMPCSDHITLVSVCDTIGELVAICPMWFICSLLLPYSLSLRCLEEMLIVWWKHVEGLWRHKQFKANQCIYKSL